jgi:MFS family permease
VSARRSTIFAVTAAASFMVYLDVTVVTVAFPSLQHSFTDASTATLSWVLSGYSVVFAALLVPFGRWGDMLGRPHAFTLGMITFVASSALCAVAPSASLLIAARILQAAGGALLVPNAQALLMSAFPAERRALAIGLFSGAGAIAAALGPLVGGVAVDTTSWRLIFLLNVPIGIAALVTGWWVSRPPTDRAEPTALEWLGVAVVALAVGSRPLVGGIRWGMPSWPVMFGLTSVIACVAVSSAWRRLGREVTSKDIAAPDLIGAALLVGTVGLLTLGLVKGRAWGWDSIGVIACFVVSVVLAPMFVLRSARHPAPVLELSLFRHRAPALANAASLLFAVAFFGMLFSGALFLSTVWDYSPLKTGLALSPAPALAALTAAFGGWLTDRHGARRATIPGTALVGFGAAWAIVATTDAHPHFVEAWLISAALVGVGVGLCAPALNSAAVSGLNDRRFGVGSGVNGMMRQVGATFGVAGVVALTGVPGRSGQLAGFHSAWAFCAVAAAGALVLSLFLSPDRSGNELGPPECDLYPAGIQASHY